MINWKTQGADVVYFTYTEQNPMAFNPFYTDDNVFDIEKAGIHLNAYPRTLEAGQRTAHTGPKSGSVQCGKLVYK